MIRVEGNRIEDQGQLVASVKLFDNLEEAKEYAEEKLDGYLIIDEESEEILGSGDSSGDIEESTLDIMYPNRHDEDFDPDQISGEDFFKE